MESKQGMPMEFYADEIEVRFEQEPVLEKKPGVPASFIWRGREYGIVELLTEWHDYRKRGKIKLSTRRSGEATGSRAVRSGAHGVWAGTTTACALPV